MGNDAQRAFGTDDKLGQVVASGILLQFAAQRDNFALGCDQLHSQHLLPGGSIFHGLKSAGVRGNIAADKGAVRAAGVIGVKITLFAGNALYVLRPDSRFHHQNHVLLIQLDHPVQPLRGQ